MQDTRVPDYDSGIHMNAAFVYKEYLAQGDFSGPFQLFDGYPPLVRVVRAITILIVGMHPMALVLSSNVVFVLLLAFGCYGVGRIVAGPRAGLFAAVFALDEDS